MNKYETADRLAKMFRDSRAEAGKSQDWIAKALGVSKKTVQNWEAGAGAPNLITALEWFECLGIPMYPYIMGLIYPEEIANIDAGSDIHELRKALHTYIDELDDLHARELLFFLHGSHGSSPTGLLDMLTAYLHLPLSMRLCVADEILYKYKLSNDVGIIRNEAHVLPKEETLQRCLDTARDAVVNGKEVYLIKRKE